MEKIDISTNIEIGKKIFENIPNDLIPGWAGLILSRFDNYIKDVPTEIKDIYPIINEKDRWVEAHKQFTKIRQFNLKNKDYKPESYLSLAEMVAKVTYNASGKPAPFDKDNGWHIASLGLNVAQYFDENNLKEEVMSVILIFNRNKGLRKNLDTANDLLIYKKIDDILWFDWDPIGVKDMAPRDEYQSYVPQIFRLKKSGADRQKIADLLLKLETETIGMGGKIENCLVIADKIIAV